jgi:hypothetical protein
MERDLYLIRKKMYSMCAIIGAVTGDVLYTMTKMKENKEISVLKVREKFSEVGDVFFHIPYEESTRVCIFLCESGKKLLLLRSRF